MLKAPTMKRKMKTTEDRNNDMNMMLLMYLYHGHLTSLLYFAFASVLYDQILNLCFNAMEL